VLQRPPASQRGQGVAKAAIPTLLEPQPLGRNFLDLRAKNYMPPSYGKTGIPFYKTAYNNIRVLNETYLCFVYTYQLCRNAYTYTDVKNAERYYHRVRRTLLLWGDVLHFSRTVQQFWKVISITFRMAKSAAKQQGLPLCGNDRGPGKPGSAYVPRDTG
jgi:hypothetical protein